ncbi:hypothetical protein [Pantoea sp. 18069]|uniref:hypothetical protein n=1 Tax=Pantoea sp. 18069 TaxID=2681415 RepID=UPI00190F1EF7|nr:hypothetical protein [Pantoea sp. 18069]
MDQTTIVFLALSVLGIGLFIAGVAVLQGLGWALLAGAGSCSLAAGFLRKGMRHG